MENLSNKKWIEAIDRIVENAGEAWQHFSTPLNPCNAYTCREYSGKNRLLVRLAQILNGVSPVCLTFKQVKELGGTVKKGAKGLPILFAKSWVTTAEGPEVGGDDVPEAERHFALRHYFVFSLSDVDLPEGKEEELTKKLAPTFNDGQPIERLEKVIESYLARPNTPKVEKSLLEGSAYFYPQGDLIRLPVMSRFKSKEQYYATLIHELAHGTGHSSRLNRHKGLSYAEEELVAETTAFLVMSQAGCMTEELGRNMGAYLKGWLKDQPKEKLIPALNHAVKAAESIFAASEPAKVLTA